MSTLLMPRLREPSPAKFTSTDPSSAKNIGPSSRSAQLKHLPSEAEPPEDWVREREAPEWRQGYHAEAPDSGRGRPHRTEGRFTQGRSRS
jgi:hypothetical protein